MFSSCSSQSAPSLSMIKPLLSPQASLSRKNSLSRSTPLGSHLASTTWTMWSSLLLLSTSSQKTLVIQPSTVAALTRMSSTRMTTTQTGKARRRMEPHLQLSSMRKEREGRTLISNLTMTSWSLITMTSSRSSRSSMRRERRRPITPS